MASAQTSSFSGREKTLFFLACALSFLTLGLLFVGAMVTSTNSGLSVPDWPTTFGRNMFTYPLREMKGGVFYEHGHRLFASGVGMLTILLVLGIFAWEPRRWVRTLSLAALVLVCLQGLFGGLTVRMKLPVEVSSAHAGMAELFFCGTVWLAWALSPAWKRSASPWRANPLAHAAVLLAALAFAQILAGAVMRHSYAGLAIPTFPRAFGEWVPPFWSQGIAWNFTHTRVGALILTGGCLLFGAAWWRSHREIKLPLFLFSVLAAQILLGMLTVWTGKVPWVASLHLATGALLFATLFSLGLWGGKTPLGRPA